MSKGYLHPQVGRPGVRERFESQDLPRGGQPLICQALNGLVQTFLERPLYRSRSAWLYFNATFLKGRLGKSLQLCSWAADVPIAINNAGSRGVLDIQMCYSESDPLCREFLGSPKQRGLVLIWLMDSNAHVGMTKAAG